MKYQEGDQAILVGDYSDDSRGIYLSRGRRVTVKEAYPSGETLRVEFHTSDGSFEGSTLIHVSQVEKAAGKIVRREFIGGPMDGHVQPMEEARETYIYGDYKGHKKGMYLLDTDDGKLYHVRE